MDPRPDLVVNVVVIRPFDHLVALFAGRPADWLRGFLLLAARTADTRQHAPSVRNLYFDLGAPQPGGPDEASFPFVWVPRASSELFDVFSGTFALAGGAEQTDIRLEGRAEGGTARCNRLALESLITLLAAAVSEVQTG